MVEFNFDANQVPADDFPSFEPIEPGTYDMQVIDSELKPTKAGTGQILKLTLEITEGPYAGRKLFENLNVQNPNPEAERISNRALADLLLALGLNAIRDSQELHFKPFKGKVTVQLD